MKTNIVIVNYRMGNLYSVKRKLDNLRATSIVTSDPKEILSADKVILVGVGHFKNAMKNLRELNLIDPLNEVALIKKKPILGICLGMQLMAKESEEGEVKGLGWVDAEIKKMIVKDQIKYKVPHMGWNTVLKVKNSFLMKGIPDSSEFYFVHSYYCKTSDKNLILNETNYAFKFTSAIEQENIFGVQYHPEKSHDSGIKLLSNFINM